jgi:hypothetical protein
MLQLKVFFGVVLGPWMLEHRMAMRWLGAFFLF